MGEVAIHHLGLAGAGQALDVAVRLEPVRAPDLGDGGAAWLRGPNLFLRLGDGDPPGPRPVNAPGIAHLCVQSRAGDAARGALERAGVRFLSEPVALGTGFLYAYAHDSAGRLLELESAPFLPDEPAAWFGHVAFVSRDAERLAGFYAHLLGAAVTPGGRFRDNARVDRVAGLDGVDVEVWWVRDRRFTLEFWRYHTPAYDGPDVDGWYTSLGLETDDLDAALARVREAGGATEDVMTGADGRAARARDPDGNRLQLIELASPSLGTATLPHADALARAAAARAAA